MIKFTEAAEKEYLEAIEYYNRQRPGLGYEFSVEIDSGMKYIERFDSAWQLLAKDIRRYLIKRFPYGIIYSIQNESIIVLSIMNLHREPKNWDELV
jgi:toxin ParE1/3/4